MRQRMPQDTSTNVREPLDIGKLVNTVADRFEDETRMKVTSGAREELIQPALPHIETVESELQSGKITETFLEESLWTVLRNAIDFVQDETTIDADATIASMRRYCPYLFWC